MAFIRTVLGDIDPSEFGVCDSHDHMIRSGGPEVVESKDFLLDDVEASRKELERWAEAGGKSMVCMDPIGCGRNVPEIFGAGGVDAGEGASDCHHRLSEGRFLRSQGLLCGYQYGGGSGRVVRSGGHRGHGFKQL